MAPVSYHRLIPDERTVEAGALFETLDLGDGATDERPHVSVNFVSSVDGRAAFSGRSAPLGDEGDRVLFHGLRERADAVLAGTGTLAAERYGRILARPDRRERRRAAGRPAEPLACVFSRSGRLPLDIPLFAEPEARIAVFTPIEPDLSEVAASVTVHRIEPGDRHPLSTAMAVLRRQHGIRGLLCEGGPRLFGALLREGLVDELFLTLAPRLAAGESGPTITEGPPLAELLPLQIVWLLQRDETLYLRYRIV